MNGQTLLTPCDRSQWLRPSVVVLILANLVPLFGVIWLGWEVFPLLLLFWFENLIVGGFNVLKMLVASPQDPLKWAAKLFLIPFFCFHYGMFTMIHGVFVIGMFGGGFKKGAPFPDTAVIWHLAMQQKLVWAILGLAASHAFSFVHNYVLRNEYRRASLPALMQQPYGRVVVLHLTILGGAFLMAALKSPVAGLVLLVVLKIVLDVRAHMGERRKFSSSAESAAPARNLP